MPEPALAIAAERPAETGTIDLDASPKLAALEPIAVDAQTAAALFGVALSSWYHADKAGLIGPEQLPAFGRAKRYQLAELRAWADAGTPPRETWKRQREGERGGSA